MLDGVWSAAGLLGLERAGDLSLPSPGPHLEGLMQCCFHSCPLFQDNGFLVNKRNSSLLEDMPRIRMFP